MPNFHASCTKTNENNYLTTQLLNHLTRSDIEQIDRFVQGRTEERRKSSPNGKTTHGAMFFNLEPWNCEPELHNIWH